MVSNNSAIGSHAFHTGILVDEYCLRMVYIAVHDHQEPFIAVDKTRDNDTLAIRLDRPYFMRI